MKKIIFINDSLNGGGTEVALINIVNSLSDKGYELTVLTSCKNNKPYDLLNKNIKYMYLLDNNKADKLFNRCIRKVLNIFNRYIINMILKMVKYDVAIAFKEGEMLKLLTSINAKKKIAWVHTDFKSFHWSKNVFNSIEKERECFNQCETIVCVSERCRKSFIDTIGLEEKTITIYNPIDYKKVKRLANEKILELNPKSNKFIFVTVGRLTAVKRYLELLEICKELLMENINNFELWIVGDGELKDDIRAYVNENRLENIILLGEKKNPFKYINAADYLILSSKSESFALVLAESMILNVPIITTNVGIAEEIVKKYRKGIVVNNLEELKEKIKEVIISHNKIEKSFINIEEIKEFDIDKVISKVEKILF